MSRSSYMSAILLFGDSLTQGCWPGSLYQQLAEAYERKLDVVNRGLSGYNTTWAVHAFKELLAPQQAHTSDLAQPLRLITIWFGANDSTLPHHFQHISVDRFARNLEEIISLVRSPDSPYYSPDTDILLIGPPPVVVSDWDLARRNQRVASSEGVDAPFISDRERGRVKAYSNAVCRVAVNQDLPCIDLYAEVLATAGGDTDEALRPFFFDGLHFNKQGYDVVTQAVLRVIKDRLPHLDPDALPMSAPRYDAIPNSWMA